MTTSPCAVDHSKRDHMRFCYDCGMRLWKMCVCGMERSIYKKFCPDCGREGFADRESAVPRWLGLCLVGLVGLLLAGCATPSYMLRNPGTDQVVHCTASGWGYVGAPMALITAKHCVDDYERIGWVKIPQ